MFLLKRSHYVVYVAMESFSKVCIGEKNYTTHVSFEAVTTAICCICRHGKFFQGLYTIGEKNITLQMFLSKSWKVFPRSV